MDDLGPEERERLLARFGKHFKSGEVLFREGEVGTEAFLLQEGRVRLIKRVRAVDRSLMVLRPGDLFGESALVPGTPRPSTAVALEDGSALALDQSTFQSLLESNRAIAAKMIRQLVLRLRDAEDRIEIMMLRDTQSKIVGAILKLARHGRVADAGTVLAVSPMELSTRVGLDIDAVKRGVQKLREGGYLRVMNERLEVPDVDALERLFSLLGVKDEIRGA